MDPQVYSTHTGSFSSLEAFQCAIIVLGLAAPSHLLIRKVRFLPQSLPAILIGICFGWLWAQKFEAEALSVLVMAVQSANHILMLYVPIFMVSSMYRTEYTYFLKHLPSALIIVFVGSTIVPLIFGIIHFLMNGYMICAIIGCILGLPNEPLHAIVILRRLARFKHLETLLEAEAVLMTIPIFISIDLLMAWRIDTISHWYQVINFILRKIIIGFIIGYLSGKINASFMIFLDHSAMYTVEISIVMTYVIFIFTEFIATGSGHLALLLNMCQVLKHRHKLSGETVSNIGTTWMTLHYIAETMCLTFTSTLLTMFIVIRHPPALLSEILGSYTELLALRIVTFAIATPFLCKMMKQQNLVSIIILSWTFIRGPFALNVSILTLICAVNIEEYIFSYFASVLLSILINAITFEAILSVLGFTKITEAQRSNINLYVDVLNKKGHYVLNSLKENRYLGGVHWHFARDYVHLQHSYESEEDARRDLDKQESHEYLNEVYCENDVPYDVTELELASMLKESEIKVLKVERILIINQYLRGDIDMSCFERIYQKINARLDSGNYYYRQKPSDEYFTPKKSINVFEKVLLKLYSVPTLTPPPSARPLRQLFFYLTMHVAYDFVVYAITFVNSMFILWNSNLCCRKWMYDYHLGLWCFYFLEFGMKIYGLSHHKFLISACKPYFYKKANWLDFFCLTVTLFNLGVQNKSNIFNWTVLYIIPSLRLIAALRLLSIFSITPRLCPYLLKYMNSKKSQRIALGYQIGTASVIYREHLITVLPEIIAKKTICHVFRKELQDHVNSLTSQLEKVETMRPEIALTVKTKQVIRITQNAQMSTLDRMQHLGALEPREFNYILSSLTLLKKKLKKLKTMSYHTQEILQGVPWIAAVTNYVGAVKMISWDAGDLVQTKGHVSPGIYVIVSGMMRLRLLVDEQEYTTTPGLLPVADKFSSLDNHLMEQVLLPGDVVGEFSYVTGRCYDCNVVAESYSQGYWFTPELLQKACEASSSPVNGLECQIWKNACLYIAIAILMTKPVYKTQTADDIKQKLQRCFMPDLRRHSIFHLTAKTSDVLLIEGSVESALTGEILTAPILIPHSVQRISLTGINTEGLHTSSKAITPKLLIVPMEGFSDEDIMLEEEQMAGYASDLRKVSFRSRSRIKTPDKNTFIRKSSEAVIANDAWAQDKEVIRLDSDSEVAPKPAPSNYDKDLETELMHKARQSRLDRDSNLSRILMISREFEEFEDTTFVRGRSRSS